MEREEVILEHKALKILIYLSFFAPIVSFLITIWTVLCLVAICFLQPVRLCKKGPSFGQQVIKFLSSAHRSQLIFIYSSLETDAYSAPVLVVVLLFSPFVAIGVALAAWVAAVFWFYAGIIGDPTGSDTPKGYNDGKASVLGVRSWWERWLERALR
ncbi:hypothetical protein EJ06DRAFT_556594 [Trichodelitschia bisporula]|uniref:Uncharacterized protein n=1 Tax=Trichodelitschia bisporula TaxID=703511 RepID=A0A6G1HWF9_9PEZI|nr:hypothetical protein EJ06DRAFT_556594 [Trichodelitschia bisporula]